MRKALLPILVLVFFSGCPQPGPGDGTTTEKTVSIFAGDFGGYNDGAGSAVRFDSPGGIAGDGTNLYVCDTYNCVIRKIVISTGAVTTFAGRAGRYGSSDGIGSAARFDSPGGITCDSTNLYVCDSNTCTIRKIVISTGAVTTLAGSAYSSGSTDGIGSAARFYSPSGITGDGTNLYVCDEWNHTIRKIVISTGAVTTLAGSAGNSGAIDGTGSAARFNVPYGIAGDGVNLYVSEINNHTIRKIVISTGAVTTLAGGSLGSNDGIGSAARFYYPGGITGDGANLYVCDTGNHTIRKIVISTGEVTTFAGSAGNSGSTDGTGSAARFYYPNGITGDGTNLYVCDRSNGTIRKIVISTGAVTTLAGSAGSSDSTDGTGGAARFDFPDGITGDGTNLYVCDAGNDTIRNIEISTGIVTTLAGSAGSSGSTDGTGSAARFNAPYGVTGDGTNLYVCEFSNHTVRKIVISTGVVTTLAGSAGSSGSTDGTGSAARFYYPYGITCDGTNLYVCDSHNHTIRRIVISTGAVTTLAGSAGSSGSTDGMGSAARFFYPEGITGDGTNLYVCDELNDTVRKIVISTGAVTTLAGSAGIPGSTDGIGSAARFYAPHGIAGDGTNLYVCDTGNCNIRKIVISTGAVTTFAGSAGSPGYQAGAASGAKLYLPYGIWYTDGKLYFTQPHCIRVIE